MIKITEEAANRFKEMSESEEIGHLTVRLKIIGGGCAGLNYDLFFDDNSSEFDETFSEHGVTIIVDPLSFQYVNGITINYIVKNLSEGFHFENPNVTATCGCGSSFSA